MSNREMVATEGLYVPITRVDRNSAVVPPPPGGVVYKVTSGDPKALEAKLGTMEDGRPAAVLRPLVQGPATVSFKVEDNLGSKPIIGELDIVPSYTSIGLGLAEAVSFRIETPPPVDMTARTAADAQAAEQNERRKVLTAKSPRTPAEEEELAKLNQVAPKP